MAVHRPIAHRVFTVLLAVLLVGSVVAPIAATPAAAQDDGTSTEEFACYSISSMAGPGGYLLNEACEDWAIDTTSYDGDAAATQTTLHGMAVSEWESQKALETIIHNYGEDTETTASLEARHAIASAYQNGSSATVADDEARKAIQAYYTQRQINTLESYSKSQSQFAHIGNITNEPDIASDFITNPFIDISHYYDSIESVRYTGNLMTHNYTLLNGTTYQYQSAVMEVEVVESSTHRIARFAPTFDAYNTSSGSFVFGDPSGSEDIPQSKSAAKDAGYTVWNVQNAGMWEWLETSTQTNVKPSYYGTDYNVEDGLPGQKVMEGADWYETMDMWSSQSASMITDYQNIASDLYSEMDAGNLVPNELRSAEGMVRFLSGDSNATEGDYRTALHYVLGTSNPNLVNTSTMQIHVDGYTDVEWDNSTDGTSRDPIPTDSMNGTVEGLLFANGVETIAANQTYSTNATDDKSFTIVREDGTDITLIEGKMTIEAIYDSGGNEVENASYSDPEYDTYDTDDFIAYLEENEEVREAIVSGDNDESDETEIGLPGIPGLPDGGGALLGIAIIAAVVLIVVGFVTNNLPGRR